MVRSIKNILASVLLLAAVVSVPMVATNVAYADQIGDCLSQGTGLDGSISSDTCQPDTTNTGTIDLTSTIKLVVNVISMIVGVVAVIMIIWGGMKYITSGGESNKITSAKNTIIYALIGLIIVALAQFIVRFVLSKTTDVVTNTP